MSLEQDNSNFGNVTKYEVTELYLWFVLMAVFPQIDSTSRVRCLILSFLCSSISISCTGQILFCIFQNQLSLSKILKLISIFFS